MSNAREAMAGNWGLGSLTMLLYVGLMILVVGADELIAQLFSMEDWSVSLVQFLVSGAFSLGFAFFYLKIVRNQTPSAGTILLGFNRFGTALFAYFLVAIFILLWSLLLIIPGIIAAYAYAQTFFVLADDPNCGAREAIQRSKEMMYGYKADLFFLGFRFLGWAILGVLSLGIGFLWIGPYMGTAFAVFFEEVKPQSRQLAEQAVF